MKSIGFEGRRKTSKPGTPSFCLLLSSPTRLCYATSLQSHLFRMQVFIFMHVVLDAISSHPTVGCASGLLRCPSGSRAFQQSTTAYQRTREMKSIGFEGGYVGEGISLNLALQHSTFCSPLLRTYATQRLCK